MTRTRYKITEPGKPHFITCTTVRWIALFSSPPVNRLLLDAMRHLQDRNRLRVHAYVIMHHHMHAIVSSTDLIRELGIFKSYTARKTIDYLAEKKAFHILDLLAENRQRHKTDRRYQLWQEGSHPELIGTADMFRQKAAYIHYNPVKCGFVDAPEDWRYSSARNYAGREALLEIDRLYL